MGSKENVGNGEEESEDRNCSLTAVVSPSCVTVKHLIKGDRETESRRKVGEGLIKGGLQSPAALEQQPDGLEGVSG